MCSQGRDWRPVASIRPRHIGRGDNCSPPDCVVKLQLRLLQFGHGTSAVETAGNASLESLARTRLQFGHGTSAVETSTPAKRLVAPRPRFNSATAHRPWRLVGTPLNGPRKSCFNSATAHRPWRPPTKGRSKRVLRELQFGHGTSAVETRRMPSIRDPRRSQLQFGHGTSAVETCLPPDRYVGLRRASIRPRHIGRGDRRGQLPRWMPATMLQFGHGTSAVET